MSWRKFEIPLIWCSIFLHFVQIKFIFVNKKMDHTMSKGVLGFWGADCVNCFCGCSSFSYVLLRSEKYLFIGINSIPSRYIQEQMETIESKKLAYCNWNPDTYDTPNTPHFYRDLLQSFEKFEIIPFENRQVHA
jgi:hypothetical protein